MKVLIISLPRTGSTSLLNKYALEYKLKKIEEPFNIRNIEKLIYNDINEHNIVIKTILDQIPINETNYIYYWFNKSKQFDKIILLSRKDLKLCAESLSFLDYNEKNGFKYTDKYEWYQTPNFDRWFKYLTNLNGDLIKLSILLNIEITYYEDIFDINSKDKLRVGNYKVKNLI